MEAEEELHKLTKREKRKNKKDEDVRRGEKETRE